MKYDKKNSTTVDPAFLYLFFYKYNTYVIICSTMRWQEENLNNNIVLKKKKSLTYITKLSLI